MVRPVVLNSISVVNEGLKYVRLILLLLLFLSPWPVQAELQLDGSLTQGGLLRGQTTPGSRVYYGKQQLKVSADGRFLLGFGRDAELSHNLTVISPDGQVSIKDLQISKRSYQVQRIDGISRRMMSPSEADLVRIRREAALTRQARASDSDLPDFSAPFSWPLVGPISGVYGSQRIFNGEPRRPHYGVDIAAPTGTPVTAPAGGRVTLAHPGMFFSGKTLIIDHGHGLSSSFLHLSKILVKSGQMVRRGQPIAEVGASGRVTGAHLDWRINWFERRLDPQLLVPPMPTKGQSSPARPQ